MTKGVAVVTGAGRGIGRAIAMELAERGYDLAVGYFSRAEAAAAVVERIQHLGRSAAAFQLDVQNPSDVTEFVDQARELGPIRAVIANATGFGDRRIDLQSALETPVPVYQSMFTARVGSLLTLVSAAGADLDDGGRVVALTSTGTRRHVPGYAPIAASMAATEAVVRYLAVELGRRGATANVVSGGVIDTDALTHIAADPQRLKSAVARATPLGRVGQPADLAGVVGFLCSASAGWVTGQTIVADGGNMVS